MVPTEAEDGPDLAEVETGATIDPAASASLVGRQAQYAHVQALSQHGLQPAQIASHVGLSERTVYRWLARRAAPHRRHHSRGRSVIDPYKAYVLKRWHEGTRKGSQLCQELKALGYRGSERAVYRYLTFLHATLLPAEQTTTSRAAVQEPFSAKKAVWLLIRQPEELAEHQRQGEERLDGWLQEASSSDLPELQHFAAGIQRDKAAVQAGLSLPYNNGPVEGHINRLTLIKRSMYDSVGEFI
jgi:transposase